MRKESKLQWRGRFLAGVSALCLVMILVIFADGFSIVSHAESKGKITVNSAIIRSEASTSSERIGSVKKDNTVTITGQVQGADDGKVWYEVWVNSTTKGYIRSDLVQITEGSTPPAGSTATAAPETPAEVTEVKPVSATVSGATSARIRINASPNSNILATVSKDHALTVTGQANGTDEYVWYQVSFISNGSQITGFVRSDFVTLSGEVIPVTQDPDEGSQPPETTQPPEQSPTQPPAETPTKEYDTIFVNEDWKLYQTSNTDLAWSIKDLINGNSKVVKTQKIVIIILVILLVGAVAAVGYLIFKLKDMMDSAYFNQVETETLRRRSAAAAQGGSQRVMHTVGTEKQSVKPAAPQGQKPAGAQSQRPAGTQGQRPAGTQGQRPAGTQGQRPAGTQGQRPAGAQGQNPAGAQGQRPAGQGQAAQNSASKPQQKDSQQAQGWQSKNFMTEEDDEFEFEFLNVDNKDK